jgi:hypothetical protein
VTASTPDWLERHDALMRAWDETCAYYRAYREWRHSILVLGTWSEDRDEVDARYEDSEWEAPDV